jgi:GH15 family glucan-1,4-alpha-glucosidase
MQLPTPRSLARAVTIALALAGASGILAAPREAQAAPAKRTWNFLTTGNGHGFQVFDHNRHRIVQFLEHPYRYIGPQPNRQPPAERQGDGVGRRNLAYDVFFGVKGAGGAGWLSDDTSGELPEYVEQTNIIRAPGTVAGTKAESFYFAPFGLERNVMVGLLHAPGASDAYALFNFHMGNGRTEPDASGESMRAAAGVPKAIIEKGPGGGAMVYVPIGAVDHASCEGVFDKGKAGQDLTDKSDCSGADITAGFQKKLGADGWMGFATSYVENEAVADAAAAAIAQWAGARTPETVLNDAKKEWDAWRKPPPEGTALCSDDEKKLWRMGEAVLRMGQVREANTAGRKNHGMVLASLPVGEWHTGWVRDALYGVVALARIGHFEEARMALDFFVDAFEMNPASVATGPGQTINGKQGKYQNYVRNKPYRISVTRYYGTGEEEADWNVDGPNVETDGWGLALWAARIYVELSGDVKWLDRPTFDGTVWDALTKGIADPIEGNLESNGIMAADSSIWEVHDAKKRHYAYTTLAAARGLCDMAGIAKKANRGEVVKYQALAKRVREGFLSTFVDPQGALAGSLEGLSNGKYTDGAVAEAFTWNILADWKGDTAKATLSLLDKLRVESEGFKRNDDGLSSYDNNEWILVDLRIANAQRRAGNTGEADRILAHVTSKAAANFYLLPELFNDTPQAGEIGIYTGSIPMVGYGGGAYIITMLDRSGIIEPNDCGDGKSAVLAKVDCGGVTVNPGNGPGTDSDGGAGGDNGAAPDASQVPYVAACLCVLGPDREIPRFGLALFIGAPLFLLARRVTRRIRDAKLARRRD